MTAGSALGVNGGAAAQRVAPERAVAAFGLTPVARIAGAATAGVAPRIIGIGPLAATRRPLGRAGLGMADGDVAAFDAAFVAQALAVTRGLGLPDDAQHVNPGSGAIAPGHPPGMSGARLALTAALELCDSGARRALGTNCAGVGQAIALSREAAA